MVCITRNGCSGWFGHADTSAFPHLDPCQSNFGSAGEVGVDDALAVVDRMTADGGDLCRGGAGLGEADDAGAAQVAALAMATGHLGAGVGLLQTLAEHLLDQLLVRLGEVVIPRAGEVAAAPSLATRARHQEQAPLLIQPCLQKRGEVGMHGDVQQDIRLWARRWQA